MKTVMSRGMALAALALALSCAGCNDDSTGDTSTSQASQLPQLTPATGLTLASACESFAGKLSFANTSITAISTVAAGTLSVGGNAVPEHCLITGTMNTRVSPVDGKTYAIGFEMRLPKAWNGRFYYQANGGLDGAVATALGALGGGPVSSALGSGFAVISSDAGHNGSQVPLFGRDPQARLDYGYNAVATLTPMAKSMIAQVYGKTPDRSYFGGCSNGGRHAMVAAARSANAYDGIVAGDPGFHLPKAAINEVYSAQQLATVATANTSAGFPDITTSLSAAERAMVASHVLAKCDALDGTTDGMINNLKACQTAFSLANDVPTCTGARDGTCLTAAQKTVMANLFAGARNSAGQALYSGFSFDAGISGSNWAAWKQGNSIQLDPAALAFVFTTTPQPASAITSLTAYGLAFNMDTDAPKIFATDATYTESAWSFMTPPDETNLGTLKGRGAKLMVYHGTSDPVFSSDDTTDWYQRLAAANGGDASNFARFYPVPGMNHCAGGPTADQFDMLTPLVAWVEHGVAPDSVVATARGPANAVPNAEVPSDWNAAGHDRTRPLCAYPKNARYTGTGNINDASSFSCQ